VTVNITGLIVLVKTIAERIAHKLDRQLSYVDDVQGDLLLANTEKLQQLLPHDLLPLETLCDWAAEWVEIGWISLEQTNEIRTLRDGKF